MRTPLALYALALLARLALAVTFPDPAYPDSTYYVNVARELAAGHGFTTDALWIFAEVGGQIPANPVLPIPSNAHWAPMASIVQVPLIWLLGPTAFASALPFALIGSLAAPLAWAVGRDAGATSRVALVAGLLVVLPTAGFVWRSQPDNFALFEVMGATCLWLAARGIRGHPRDFAAAGFLAGVATWSRTEGGLILLVLMGLAAFDRLAVLRASRAGNPRSPKIPARATIGAVGLYLLAIGPWWLRQLAVFGSISPSTATGKVLFMRDFSEWNSLTAPATLDHLLGMGIGPLLASRVDTLAAILLIFSVLVCGLVFLPFLFIGSWRRRSDAAFRPAFWFAGTLLVFSSTLAALHATGGQFIHTVVALVPHAYVLVAEGIAATAVFLAARRPKWRRDETIRGFLAIAVGIAVLTAVLGVVRVHDSWDARRDRRQMAAAALDAIGAGPSDRVMSIDAAAFRYWTGRPGIVIVDDPMDTIEKTARAYGARWLVLEADEIVPAMHAVLVEDKRPPWIGPEVFRDGEGSQMVAIYALCLVHGDPGCDAATVATP